MKLFTKILASSLLFASVSVAVPATAQEASAVVVTGDVKQVEVSTDANGEEVTKLVDLGVTVPGTRLVFRTNYENTTQEVIRNFKLTNPIHPSVRLAPDADGDLTVSVDGGNTWGPLSSLSVSGEDGSARSATHADVTHVRWTIAEIAPGAGGQVQIPAIIR
ncbi:hypothetical protein INR77_08320 [Erythrobacter sp. SCSIO 43205]|uniref:hypothetical protein n=1 Tax=Erythrobacter sp. SCSIO 43205 TaxID=2779361 RepID=UPI001CA807AD|nr:hypothetical protein [Erythrobacter sp. SCSIO 43205]UAB76860.1 hypothetical protein INR77_08320 [Erythrobacter sp. SCSIO 43205]